MDVGFRAKSQGKLAVSSRNHTEQTKVLTYLDCLDEEIRTSKSLWMMIWFRCFSSPAISLLPSSMWQFGSREEFRFAARCSIPSASAKVLPLYLPLCRL